MSNLVKIGNQEISTKEFNNQRVVTFKDIDTVHERAEGTARKRFNDNKKHFIEGTDFFKITPSEFRTANERESRFATPLLCYWNMLQPVGVLSLSSKP